MGGSKIDLEPHILQRLMPDKRIYHFQTPRTTPTNVLKSDFFLVVYEVRKGPPYESWANRTNFLSSWKNGEFFWGQTCFTLFHTQNEEKSQKISTRIRKYVMVGANLPPPFKLGLERWVLKFEPNHCWSLRNVFRLLLNNYIIIHTLAIVDSLSTIWALRLLN